MKIVTYQCDTCRRTVEKEDDPRRVMALSCNITLNCPGLLEPIDESAVRTELLPPPVSGVQDWSSRFVDESVVTEQVFEFGQVNSSAEGLVTIAIPEMYAAVDQITLGVSRSSTTPVSYVEYSYTKPLGTQTISGADDDGKVLVIRPGDRVRLVVGSAEMVGFSIIGSTISLSSPLQDRTNLIRVIVSTPSATDQIYLTALRHDEDSLFSSGWSNVRSVTVDGMSYRLYSIQDALTKIPTKTAMRFTSLAIGATDFSSLLPQTRILLCSSPYDWTTRVLGSYIVMSQVMNFSTKDNDTNVYVEKTVIKSVFPLVQVTYNNLFLFPEEASTSVGEQTTKIPTYIV